MTAIMMTVTGSSRSAFMGLLLSGVRMTRLARMTPKAANAPEATITGPLSGAGCQRKELQNGRP